MDYPLAHYHRSTELLKRWIETEAFAGSMFRTHVGSSFEDSDAQVWDDDDTMSFFGKFASIFGYLKAYRGSLFDQAEQVRGSKSRSNELESSVFYAFLFSIDSSVRNVDVTHMVFSCFSLCSSRRFLLAARLAPRQVHVHGVSGRHCRVGRKPHDAAVYVWGRLPCRPRLHGGRDY